jgi:type IV pilus assembly protein PilA
MKRSGGFSLIELLIVVIIILIIAAIAIPSLLRARISANESAVIGDTRTVMSASHAYAAANAGLFEGDLTCLTNAPNGTCIPNYPSTAPTFLDSAISNLMFKSGYNRTFLPGAAPAPLPPAASPSSVSSYVYVSSPGSLGRTGVRGFGGDSSGVLCTSADGTQPATKGNIELNPTPGACDVLQ